MFGHVYFGLPHFGNPHFGQGQGSPPTPVVEITGGRIRRLNDLVRFRPNPVEESPHNDDAEVEAIVHAFMAVRRYDG